MSEENEVIRVLELSASQRRIIDEAIAKAKTFAPGEEDEGRLLEIICIDFLESFND